jgi:branched-chain amino acid transport system ATP-binding protein
MIGNKRTAVENAEKAGLATLLKVENLESFYGPIMAIRGVSLVVPEGKVVTVLGANGAGKTTLMKTISGVMDPQKGKITYQGRDITGMAPEKIVREGIVHVPEGREVFPLLSVEDNLSMGAFTRRDGAREIAKDLEMVFGYFPILKERRLQQAGTLSGGQQQMLAIARGLMSRPKLMLLDEPSLGLSPILVKEILTIIRRLNREQGVTMLLVEQNAKAALDVADYGYVMDLGRIVIDGTAETLKQSKDVQEFYLGVQSESQRGQKRWKQKKTWR